MDKRVSERPSTETQPAKLEGISRYLGLAAIFFLIGVFLWPFLILSILVLFFGIPRGLRMRVGACPNCGSEVNVVSKKKCGTCKHRLMMKDKRLSDVT
jgi:hypothetical protein